MNFSSTDFAIVKIKQDNYIHIQTFDEIIESLKYGLLELGYSADIYENAINANKINIIIGAHLLPNNFILPQRCIIYNFEQLKGSIFGSNNSYRNLLKNNIVWDYSNKNINILKILNINGKYQHVPIGYVSQLTKITKAEEDIDFLFYGCLNPRRKLILEELSKKGFKVICLFGKYGKERDDFIARSKVILNIHYYEPEIFEIVRTSYLFSNNKLVISEFSDNLEIDDYVKDIVIFEKYDKFINKCIETINNPILMKETTDKAFKIFSDKKEKDILEVAINDLKLII